MKTLPLCLVMLLSACATYEAQPPDPDAQRQYEARLVATYGPRCEAAGMERDSHEYNDCLMGFARQEQAQNQAQRAAAAAAILGALPRLYVPPQPAIYTPPPQVNCQSYVIGGIVQTRCQ